MDRVDMYIYCLSGTTVTLLDIGNDYTITKTDEAYRIHANDAEYIASGYEIEEYDANGTTISGSHGASWTVHIDNNGVYTNTTT